MIYGDVDYLDGYVILLHWSFLSLFFTGRFGDDGSLSVVTRFFIRYCKIRIQEFFMFFQPVYPCLHDCLILGILRPHSESGNPTKQIILYVALSWIQSTRRTVLKLFRPQNTVHRHRSLPQFCTFLNREQSGFHLSLAVSEKSIYHVPESLFVCLFQCCLKTWDLNQYFPQFPLLSL